MAIDSTMFGEDPDTIRRRLWGERLRQPAALPGNKYDGVVQAASNARRSALMLGEQAADAEPEQVRKAQKMKQVKEWVTDQLQGVQDPKDRLYIIAEGFRRFGMPDEAARVDNELFKLQQEEKRTQATVTQADAAMKGADASVRRAGTAERVQTHAETVHKEGAPQRELQAQVTKQQLEEAQIRAKAARIELDRLEEKLKNGTFTKEDEQNRRKAEADIEHLKALTAQAKRAAGAPYPDNDTIYIPADVLMGTPGGVFNKRTKQFTPIDFGNSKGAAPASQAPTHLDLVRQHNKENGITKPMPRPELQKNYLGENVPATPMPSVNVTAIQEELTAKRNEIVSLAQQIQQMRDYGMDNTPELRDAIIRYRELTVEFQNMRKRAGIGGPQ